MTIRAALISFYLLFVGLFPAYAETAPYTEKEISYERFLEWRDDADTVVVDAYALEPLLHVAPKHLATEGLTQEALDALLQEMIPSKKSRVLLFCWQNFAPTRSMGAKSSVAYYLNRLGYENVYTLEDLWARTGPFGIEDSVAKNAEQIRDKEVLPYAVPIPSNLKKKLPEN